MELMNQPFTGQLGNRLIELLDSQEYHTLNIVVAFAKNSGVLRIKDSLERFRRQNGKINAYVGVDLSGTSYEALTTLLIHTDSLNVVHSEKSQTFHSKIYQFIGEDKELIVVGSHNLTGGGLWTNFESSVIIPIDNSSTNNIQMSDYFRELTLLKDSFMPIKEQGDIDRLLLNGYLVKEVAEQIRLAKTNTQDEARESLFGNGIPARLPCATTTQENENTISIPETQTSSSSASLNSGEGQTIWFETRCMTGGSRNILDLSRTSLVERGDPRGTCFDLNNNNRALMLGAVAFFGLNHTETNNTKDITLHFEGVDYINNMILFPAGERANGTWRLQIKGINSSERKITDAFRDKGEEHYLVQKIITFTKIQGDYYSISVYPESELSNFQEASRILARNGATRTAKQLGLL
ncbi:hypothetical protein [Photobacterium indicum]|uniref:hypothetical protein n=1 Tax=Photobacterium indicum TaxID=81447 RepID=UPI003D0F166B